MDDQSSTVPSFSTNKQDPIMAAMDEQADTKNTAIAPSVRDTVWEAKATEWLKVNEQREKITAFAEKLKREDSELQLTIALARLPSSTIPHPWTPPTEETQKMIGRRREIANGLWRLHEESEKRTSTMCSLVSPSVELRTLRTKVRKGEKRIQGQFGFGSREEFDAYIAKTDVRIERIKELEKAQKAGISVDLEKSIAHKGPKKELQASFSELVLAVRNNTSEPKGTSSRIGKTGGIQRLR